MAFLKIAAVAFAIGLAVWLLLRKKSANLPMKVQTPPEKPAEPKEPMASPPPPPPSDIPSI